jgi:hypothetical protein
MFLGLCMVFAFGGAALVAHGVRRFLDDRRLSAAAAGGWGTVQGEILSAALDVSDAVTADAVRLTSYRPLIRYRYAAAGADHVGSAVWLTRDAFGDEAAARQWLVDHQPGRQVTVRFDPGQPDRAALVIDCPSAITAMAVGGVGLVLAWTGMSLLLEV